MKPKHHINIIILFEILIPLLAILWPILAQSNPGFGKTLIAMLLLHILGRIISRNIPTTCDSCLEEIKPRGTSIIYYECKDCGLRYAKSLNRNHHSHD